jgi:hypothetical protein
MEIFAAYDWKPSQSCLISSYYCLLAERYTIQSRYHMYIKYCQKLCTLCPLYRPDQGDIVGREYIIFSQFFMYIW